MSPEHTCQTCGKPLEQAKTGRRRKFCSTACKSRAQRRFAPLRAFRTGAKPTASEPANQVLHIQARRLARVKELARALARVRAAEEQLAAAKAARAALLPEERDPSVCTTYTGDEWLQRDRGGMPAGSDTGEVVDAIRRRLRTD
jgi:hypothetical protein